MTTEKLKLLVVELDYHASLLNSLCPMLMERFHVSLLITRKGWEKVSLPEEAFAGLYIKEDEESIGNFMERAKCATTAVDAIYFNTMEKYASHFSRLQFPCPVIWRVHNVNATFNPLASIDVTPFNWPKAAWYIFVKSTLERAWAARKRLADNVDLIMLPTAGVLEYSRKHGLLNSMHNVSSFCLPFSCLNEQPPKDPALVSERIVIAVTGTVDVARKDYEHLLGAMVLLKSRLSQPIELHFLGAVKGADGRAVVERFRALEDQKFSFHFASGFVPQVHMDKVMARAHFLVAPIKLESNFKMHKEYYGRTKMSGIEIDAINYRKLAFVPQEYYVAENMQSVLRQYQSATDLADQIQGFVAEGYGAATDFAQLDDYKRDNILDRFEELLRQKIAEH